MAKPETGAALRTSAQPTTVSPSSAIVSISRLAFGPSVVSTSLRTCVTAVPPFVTVTGRGSGSPSCPVNRTRTCAPAKPGLIRLKAVFQPPPAASCDTTPTRGSVTSALTSMLNVASRNSPPVSLTRRTKAPTLATTGVPEITPAGDKDKPCGNAPEKTAQL